MDSLIKMRTICGTVNHRTVSHDAQNLLSTVYIPQSPKFKRVSLNETPELPFWGLNICVDFDLRNSGKNGEYEETK